MRRDKIIKWFQSNGYPNAYDDGTVLKIEEFPRKFDLQVWLKDSNVYVGVYIQGRKASEDIKKIVGEEWHPDWAFDSGHSRNWSRKFAVGVLLKMKFKSSKCIAAKDVGAAYKELRERVHGLIGERICGRELCLMYFAKEQPDVDLFGVDDFLSAKRFSINEKETSVSAYDLAETIIDMDREDKASYRRVKGDNFNVDEASTMQIFNGFLDASRKGAISFNADDIGRLQAAVAEISVTRHLVKMFAHTRCKNYENYVVMGVWHRLRAANINIRPVTQQFVTRSDGDYERAFIDLYFPSIKFAVECDEKHHRNQVEDDRTRQAEVSTALAIGEENFVRVDAAQSYERMDTKISEIVDKITKLCDTSKSDVIKRDWLYYDPVAAVRSKGFMEVADGYVFGNDRDIISALGAVNYPRKKSIQGNVFSTCIVTQEGEPMRLYFLSGEDIEFVSQDIRDDVIQRIVSKRMNANGTARRGIEETRIRQSVLEEMKWRNINDDYADKVCVHDDSIMLSGNKNETASLLMPEQVAFFARFKDRTGLDGYRFVGVYSNEGDGNFVRQSMRHFVRQSKRLNRRTDASQVSSSERL